ncbi:MAG: tetratricopeptide repeat protein [Planctomycetota bacterium]|nr:tetratricopeptide repeat protein [Planctomycetota bacterium]
MRRSVLVLLLLALCAGWNASAADRETALALLQGAEALLQQGQHSKAVEVCDRALASDAACAEAWFAKARCQEGMGLPGDAFASYRKAETLAREGNPRLMRQAHDAAEKISPGLIRLGEADEALIQKLLPLAQAAQEAGHLETALEAYAIVLNLEPGHKAAEDGQREAQKTLLQRGDLVESQLAEAMLSEIWYLMGAGKKSEARQMAGDLSKRYPKTNGGREAIQLLAADLKAPKKEDVAALSRQVVAEEQRREKIREAVQSAQAQLGEISAKPAVQPRAEEVSVAKLERSAEDEAKSVDKAQLSAKFKEAYAAGKAEYAQAAPGATDNQKHLAAALEAFTRCEALYLKLEEQKLLTPEIENLGQEASMLRYGCMKMTILTKL